MRSRTTIGAYHRVFESITGDLVDSGDTLRSGDQARKGGAFSDGSDATSGVSAGDHAHVESL
jgi:hypothetical protein